MGFDLNGLEVWWSGLSIIVLVFVFIVCVIVKCFLCLVDGQFREQEGLGFDGKLILQLLLVCC